MPEAIRKAAGIRAPDSLMHIPDNYCVYRWYDADDVLLYVGITRDIKGRSRSHRLGSIWFEFAVRRTLVAAPQGLEDARLREREAIHAEHPVFNRTHNHTPTQSEEEYLREHGLTPRPVGRPMLLGEIQQLGKTAARPRPVAPFKRDPEWLKVYHAICVEIRPLAVGARIPAPAVFALKHGVSKGTVRKAIDRLKEEGRLSGVSGLGMFVTTPPDDAPEGIPTAREVTEGLERRFAELEARVAALEARVDDHDRRCRNGATST